MHQTTNLKNIYDAFKRLKNKDEIRLFIRDLCTTTEIDAMQERWEIAQLVKKGIPYRKISEMTGASTATITRVARWMKEGSGGYNLILDRFGR